MRLLAQQGAVDLFDPVLLHPPRIRGEGQGQITIWTCSPTAAVSRSFRRTDIDPLYDPDAAFSAS
jgi:hypothetical protein